MGFAERAVNACVKAMEEGKADEMLTQNVLNCEKASIWRIEPFLVHPSVTVRWMAVRIVGSKGNVDSLLVAALHEQDKLLLNEMLKWLGKRKAEGIEALEGLLRSEDTLIKEAAIEMFRRAGKTDQLFPMLFDGDDKTVQRIKRYFNEQER